MGKKAEGKLAARAKKAQARPLCPDPGCNGEAEHVLYYPEKGRGRKALRCLKTQKVWVFVRPGGVWETVIE